MKRNLFVGPASVSEHFCVFQLYVVLGIFFAPQKNGPNGLARVSGGTWACADAFGHAK